MPKFLQAGSVDLLYFKLIPIDLTDFIVKISKGYDIGLENQFL